VVGNTENAFDTAYCAKDGGCFAVFLQSLFCCVSMFVHGSGGFGTHGVHQFGKKDSLAMEPTVFSDKVEYLFVPTWKGIRI
jgi:hypothetical protein